MTMSGDELKQENPVARALVHQMEVARRLDGNSDVEELVLKYGLPFIGTARPRGYRLRRKKECFLNSYYAADEGLGFYVEGYALHKDLLFQHAWITLDGLHALDVTLRGPISDYRYFGIPFSLEILSAEISVRNNWQFPLFDYAVPMARMEDLLQKAITSPPDYARCAEPAGAHSMM
jgi:hypothetical protein